MTSRKLITTCVIATAFLAVAIYAVVPGEFKPDGSFTGSSVKTLRTLGTATWDAKNGAITATVPAGQDGGWLLLDKSFQDVELFSSVECAAGCKAGILLRASKTADGGLQGLFVSLTNGDLAGYHLVLDAQGHEVKRERLTPAAGAGGGGGGGGGGAAAGGGGGGRGAGRGGANAAGAEANAAAGGAPAGGAPAAGRGRGRGGAQASLREGDNELNIIASAEYFRAELNGTNLPGGAAGEGADGYGPIALYAGSGQVTFKDVAWKDLNSHVDPKEHVSDHFTMQRINGFDYGADAAVADVTHDGVADIVSGPFYYVGPSYTERRQYRVDRMYNPSLEYAPDMINFAHDFTGDGWPDILSSTFGTTRAIDLYVNPKGELRRWDHYRVMPDVTTEIVLMKDIDGDGQPEIIFGTANGYQYAKPDPANPTAQWPVVHISEGQRSNNHGLGVGDINGDGRMDLVTAAGWYEQPPKGTAGPWKFHAANLGNGGAEMGVYDVNGDGLTDVVTSMAAHDWGLAWFEQKRAADGTISFVQHNIAGNYASKNAGDVAFSEPHGAGFADIDGDGIPDFIVGKKRWSHLENYNGPDPYAPAVLYVYRTVRNPKAEGGAEFVPELVHNQSGVGSAFAIADLNKDGALDIITSSDLGTYIFYGKPGSWGKKKAPANSTASR